MPKKAKAARDFSLRPLSRQHAAGGFIIMYKAESAIMQSAKQNSFKNIFFDKVSQASRDLRRQYGRAYCHNPMIS